MATGTLSDFVPNVTTQDTRKRQQCYEVMSRYLSDPRSSLVCEDMDALVEGLTAWVTCSNYKVRRLCYTLANLWTFILLLLSVVNVVNSQEDWLSLLVAILKKTVIHCHDVCMVTWLTKISECCWNTGLPVRKIKVERVFFAMFIVIYGGIYLKVCNFCQTVTACKTSHSAKFFK